MQSNRQTKKIWTLLFLAVFVLLLGCQKEVGAGAEAPGFSLPDLSGSMKSLEQYRGSVVLLDFWATWCGPCRRAIPELVKLQEKYRDRGLVVLGISLDNPGRVPDAHLRAFKGRFKMNYAVLRSDNKIVQAYFEDAKIGIPTLFVIDRKGKIRDKIVGFMPGAVEKSLAGILE